jgi:NAD(P)-dependent dehydrogenase (short-subunit alcohol dehydrogenase family)
MDVSQQKIVLVTGASSGIGKAVARVMAQDGCIVYGTSRSANFETIRENGIAYTMLPLTLEDEDTAVRAVQYVIDRHGRIDVLVNNAGTGYAGAIEETTAREAQAQFDACFFGAVRMLNHVLPHMRAAGSGVVINVGSLASCFPVPFQAMYSAAKAALFAMTVALRLELAPFGIRACVIEPGNTRTDIISRRRYSAKTCQTAYRQPLERSLGVVNSYIAACSPEQCARLALKVSRMKNPPARITPGLGYKFVYALSRLAPWRFREYVIRRIYLYGKAPRGAEWTLDKQFKEK